MKFGLLGVRSQLDFLDRGDGGDDGDGDDYGVNVSGFDADARYHAVVK
jgi:hypothetical protein